MSDLYTSGRYQELNPSLHQEDSPWKVEQILKMIRRHALAPRTVCDVGCGAGEILKLLQPHLAGDAVLHGYDLNPRAIEISASKENERLRYYCRDLVEDAAPRYDLLLSIDVFEHVEDYLGFLRRMKPLSDLKIFHIPLEFNAWTSIFVDPVLRNRTEVGHLHVFNRATALATLRHTGYEVIDEFYTAHYLLGLHAAGRLMRLMRKIFRFAGDDLSARALGGYSLLVLAR